MDPFSFYVEDLCQKEKEEDQKVCLRDSLLRGMSTDVDGSYG